MTQISGKLAHWKESDMAVHHIGNVTIELPTVDVSKIKEGDKCWVEMYTIRDPDNNELYFGFPSSLWVKNQHPIAHFPKQEVKQERPPCTICGKRYCLCLSQYKPKEHKCLDCTTMEECDNASKSEPKAELPEEIHMETDILLQEDIVKAINKLIRVVKQMQGDIAKLSEKIESGK